MRTRPRFASSLLNGLVFAGAFLASTASGQVSFNALGLAGVFAITDDGTFITGRTSSNYTAVRWNRTTSAATTLFQGDPRDISADGTVVAGNSFTGPGKWTEGPGFTPFQSNDGRSWVAGVSDDGAVVVGTRNLIATRWDGTVPQALGLLPGGRESEATAISGDGTTIVGASGTANPQVIHAVRWTETEGLVDLGLMGNYNSRATAVSADGAFIVGYGVPLPGTAGLDGWLWSEAGPAVRLHLPSLDLIPTAVSGDGSLVVGYTYGVMDFGGGFMWTAESGVRDFRSIMSNEYGLAAEIAEWSRLSITAMSSDGRYLIGNGTRQGQADSWVLDRGLNPPDLEPLPPPFTAVPEPEVVGLAAAALMLGAIYSRRFAQRHGAHPSIPAQINP